MDKIIELKGISYSYSKTDVLSNINLVITQGDFVGIIGPNGSGKTTLLKIILGILPLQSGIIKVMGKSLETFDNWPKIGYVPQKASNIEQDFPATVIEVVLMGLISTKSFPRIFTGQDKKKAKDALRIVHMEDFSYKRIGELSGGQQQRVLIAKAIVSNPKILFLDEPTTGVDQDSQKKFYELLADLNKSGTTIILVSHDIGRITKYVTKIASLNQTMEFYGTHSEFCAHDKKHTSYHTHELCLDKG
jgi:zinc transport system ATP-binding protein